MPNLPAFPKPSQIKPRPVFVRRMRSGAEQCNMETAEGCAEYERRKRIMWERQGGMCCLHGYIKSCPGKLEWADATFDHEVPRGHGGGSRDDRIIVNGKWQNGAAHLYCNGAKGSRRVNYNEAHNRLVAP